MLDSIVVPEVIADTIAVEDDIAVRRIHDAAMQIW